jgi:hypothetical protein
MSKLVWWRKRPPVPDWIDRVHYYGPDERMAHISMDAWHVTVWLLAEQSYLLGLS